jgi:hypothetical protein
VSTHEDQDVPIECWDWVVSQSVGRTDNVVEYLVVGGDPRYPTEGRKSRKQVVGKLACQRSFA